VVTDFASIQELTNHGVSVNDKQSAELAINAGTDMDMGSESFIGYLKQSVQEGKVTMATIDAACRRVLEIKYKLGLFTNPYRNFDPEKATRVTLTKENRKTAKEAALKSMVLLENKNNTLPLKKNCKIALIGPFADSKPEMLSMWAFSGNKDSIVSIYMGIKKTDPNVGRVKGTQISDDDYLGIFSGYVYEPEEQTRLVNEALELAKKLRCSGSRIRGNTGDVWRSA